MMEINYYNNKKIVSMVVILKIHVCQYSMKGTRDLSEYNCLWAFPHNDLL